MEEDEVKVSKPGVVNIDGVYGFKVDTDCYPFGKFKNGELVANLYPTSIDGVFRQYFKHKSTDLAANKQLELYEFLDIVNEIKKTVTDIKELLEL